MQKAYFILCVTPFSLTRCNISAGRDNMATEAFPGHLCNIPLSFTEFADVIQALRKHAYSNILNILQPNKGKLSDKKFWYFSYFCSKRKLWYPLEPQRGGSRVPTVYVLQK